MRAVLCAFIALIAIHVNAQETAKELQLQSRVDSLERRLAEVEARLALVAASSPLPAVPAAAIAPTAAATPKQVEPAATGLPPDTTLNVTLDGYYAFNFNKPYTRENQLRGFDQSHNSFSLNQATIILERTPSLEVGRRFGGRIDLQFGQATQTLQGSLANENRPEIYRTLFQVYGSFVAPIGSGLQTDFGKFASSLGYETNYTKDQPNYSRSLWFNYLPYYHFGFRNNYNFNSKLTAQYWLVNGSNQSEDFNGFKSQAFQLTARPAKTVSWTSTYYFGKDGRQVILRQGDFGSAPSTTVFRPNGQSHIFDSYLAWTPGNWTAVLEADYTINRNNAKDSPGRVDGGAAYLQYQVSPKFGFAGRFELLQDRSGFFSNKAQTLKEFTLTGTRTFTGGFQAKLEYRRDFSNMAYFTTNQIGALKRNQDTATLGLIWWLGGKSGSW